MQEEVAIKPFVKTSGNHRTLISTFGFLAVCILAFGLFIPQLGFYWDDWPTIFYTYSDDIDGLTRHFSYDRPFSVWAYFLIGRFGTSLLVWHISALVLRWLVVLAMVWAIQPLWPKLSKKILYIGLIFAVYPGYTFQPLSVIFVAHLAAYGLFFVSLGAMGRSAISEERSRNYAFLAFATGALHLFTLEYYAGLELIRPLFLWFVLNNAPRRRPTVRAVFNVWWPFILLFVAWLIWRLIFFDPPIDPYPTVLISEFRNSPISALRSLAQIGMQDLAHSLVAVWADLVRPSLFSLQTLIDRLAWFVALLSGGLIAIITQIFVKDEKEPQITETKFAKQSLVLGIFAFVCGLFPVWIIGEATVQGGYSHRYILIAMFGLASTLVGLVCFFVTREANRALLITLLAAAAISGHVRQTDSYRQDWEVQRNFYWQLFWRAPSLENETALVSFDRISRQMGDPMTGNALNVLYSKGASPNVGLWNFELNRTLTVNNIRDGNNLINHYRGLNFSTGNKDDLVFYYQPPDGCVWILTPAHINNNYLPNENRELVTSSNIANVVTEPETISLPAENIFGEEPPHEWCYYFEKASLAWQEADWEGVISLYAAAESQGFKPGYGIEWLPLLDAYINLKEWDAALDLSMRIHEMHSRNDAMVCNSWSTLTFPEQANLQPYLDDMDEVARCQLR